MSAGGVSNQPGTGLRVSIDQTRVRQTPQTDFGSVVKEGLSKTADAVMDAGKLAAPFIPGGAVVSAAITGLGQLKSTAGAATADSTSVGGNATSLNLASTGTSTDGVSTSSTGTTDYMSSIAQQAAGGNQAAQQMMATQQMQEMNQSFNMQYLMLQQKMQANNRQFTLLSNIMKTKHDTAKNAINNVR